MERSDPIERSAGRPGAALFSYDDARYGASVKLVHFEEK
jgi:hypothetical protein